MSLYTQRQRERLKQRFCEALGHLAGLALMALGLTVLGLIMGFYWVAASHGFQAGARLAQYLIGWLL